MEGHRPKIPRVIPGIAVHALPLQPMEGFVLSRIDATATVSDIADLTSLDHEEVARIIDKLILLGAVEWADGAVHLPRTSAKSIAPPRASPTRTSQIPADRVAEIRANATPSGGVRRPPIRVVTGRRRSSQKNLVVGLTGPREPAQEPAAPPKSPAPPPTDGIELPMERRERIDNLYVALDLLNHYEILDVKRKASRNEVRAAYFELSKVFHPDTAFRKNVGSYRQKMEAIFTRLTEAYEVLGKKQPRAEYDAYLESIGETRDAEEALSGENEIPAELRTPAEPTPPAEPPPPVVTPAAPPAPLPTATLPTEEGKRIARELLQRRLGRPTSSAPGTIAAKPTQPEPPPPPAVERTKREVLRDLATSLKSTAAQTGGLDRVVRLVAEAQKAEQERDLAGAVRAYRLALALAPERQDVAAAHERLATELAVSLADRYEQQAEYEERHQKWGSAATSWAKVVEGRPRDGKALERAALALVEAKGDLHRARDFAQKAVSLRPEDAAAHFALGRVFFAAGLMLNAKRELEEVRKLDATHAKAQLLLREIAQRG